MAKYERTMFSVAVAMLLAACASSSSQQPSISDQARIEAAKAELTIVKNALGMFQAESDIAAYPSAADMTSYQAIKDVLSPYIRMPASEEASWTFASYARARPDTFVLRARAHDKARTWITVTPTVIPPKDREGAIIPR
ncbi:hypothetical protein ACFL6T_02735 [Candidatus Zixiibacteriota bacterium]